jgi:NAD(P)-dependent dehydrogenase (short-subunit alcohol dehydrogenase family)/acyl carrier protein
MSQFLKTQSEVMTAYLQSSSWVSDSVDGGPQDQETAGRLGAHLALPKESEQVQPTVDTRRTPAQKGSLPRASDRKDKSPSSPAGLECTGELLRIVSERTGYSTELLGLDLSLEADLGIDSIKRVEILSAFQRIWPSEQQRKIQTVMEKLTSLKTLREMADTLSSCLSEKSGAPETPQAAPEPRPQEKRREEQPSSAGKQDIAEQLLHLVSDRTGYPLGMLRVDSNIEADLGIDSIKRVEILSTFQKSLLPEEQPKIQAIMDKLTSSRTFRELAEVLSAALMQDQAPTRAVRAVRKEQFQEAPSEISRFTFRAVDAPLTASRGGAFSARACVITDDESGLAEAVAVELRKANQRALLLRHRPETAGVEPELYSTDLTKPEQVQTALEMIRDRHGPIGAIIHLLPLRPGVPFGQLTFNEWRTDVDLNIKSLYALARFAHRDLLSASKAGGAMFAAATAMGGTFGIHPTVLQSPAHAGIAAFIKTLAAEWPNVICKVVDLNLSDSVVVLKHNLVAELTSRDETVQSGYLGERRVTVVPKFTPLENGFCEYKISSELPSGQDLVFLMTGGARGITAEIASYLARSFRAKLVLAGLSPLPYGEESKFTAEISDPHQLKSVLAAQFQSKGGSVRLADVNSACQRILKDREIRRNLANLAQAAVSVEYHQVDVCDERAFGALIDAIYEKYGRIDAVIHGAGVIEDKLVADKTPESFDRVLRTKTDSAFLLSRKLKPESLKLLIFMSSVSAAFGNRGQSDYAAANGVLNGLAALLSAEWPGRVVAINWAPWDQVGMVSNEVRNQFLTQGIPMIAPAAGSKAVYREIECGDRSEALIVLGDGPWSQEFAQQETDTSGEQLRATEARA